MSDRLITMMMELKLNSNLHVGVLIEESFALVCAVCTQCEERESVLVHT